MKTTIILKPWRILATAFVALIMGPSPAQAHCDSLDGPVVKAAQRAFAEGNVNHVLIWVRKEDETSIKSAFEKALEVRKLNKQAKELADLYFFETLVRIHRAGEGASYTGLKPAGGAGPTIVAGDKALQSGNVDLVVKVLSEKLEYGLRDHFQAALRKGRFDPDDVEAGRAFVKAYVEYIHYIERTHEAMGSPAHNHLPPVEQTSAPQHEHKKTH